jgi:hypothetical protein
MSGEARESLPEPEQVYRFSIEIGGQVYEVKPFWPKPVEDCIRRSAESVEEKEVLKP